MDLRPPSRRALLRRLLGIPSQPAAPAVPAQAPPAAKVGAGDLLCWGTTTAKVTAAIDVDGLDICLSETVHGPACLHWADGAISPLEPVDPAQAPALQPRAHAAGRPVAASRQPDGQLWVAWGPRTWVKNPDANAIPAHWVTDLGPT